MPTSIQHDVFDDWLNFLHDVVCWAKAAKEQRDTGMLAITAIRKANIPLSPEEKLAKKPPQRVFAGAGVYTVVEMFHFAGSWQAVNFHSLAEFSFMINRYLTKPYTAWASSRRLCHGLKTCPSGRCLLPNCHSRSAEYLVRFFS